MKNLWGKTRKVDEPYVTLYCGSWCYKVLKAYQTAKAEKANPYARWFCVVTSPMTGSSGDWGDTYIKDVMLAAREAGVQDQLEDASEARMQKEMATG